MAHPAYLLLYITYIICNMYIVCHRTTQQIICESILFDISHIYIIKTILLKPCCNKTQRYQNHSHEYLGKWRRRFHNQLQLLKFLNIFGYSVAVDTRNNSLTIIVILNIYIE